MDLALDNLQKLIYHKINQPTNQPEIEPHHRIQFSLIWFNFFINFHGLFSAKAIL